jgi:hypothetical protein
MAPDQNPYLAPQSQIEGPRQTVWWPRILVWLIAALLLIHASALIVLFYLWKIGVIGPPLTD